MKIFINGIEASSEDLKNLKSRVQDSKELVFAKILKSINNSNDAVIEYSTK